MVQQVKHPDEAEADLGKPGELHEVLQCLAVGGILGAPRRDVMAREQEECTERKLVLAAGHQNYISPSLGELFCEFNTNSGGSAGDQGDLSFAIEHTILLA